MRDQNKAYLYAITTVLLWSTVASAFKISLRYLAHLQLLFYAGLASSCTLALLIVIQGKQSLVFTYSKKQYLKSLLLGLLNPCLYYLILFKAYDLLPAQEAQPLNYTWAITLSLLSIPLLKQRIKPQEILAGFVCYSGALVISTRGNILDFRLSDPLGVTLALVSTIVWALFWIYNTRDDRDAVVGLFLNFTFALPFTFALCLVFSDLRISSLYGLMGAVYVGFVEMGIAVRLPDLHPLPGRRRNPADHPDRAGSHCRRPADPAARFAIELKIQEITARTECPEKSDHGSIGSPVLTEAWSLPVLACRSKLVEMCTLSLSKRPCFGALRRPIDRLRAGLRGHRLTMRAQGAAESATPSHFHIPVCEGIPAFTSSSGGK